MKVKAWLAKDKNEFHATVVFAETRGKAKSIAMRTEACEDVDFCNIYIERVPQIDKYYKEGKKEMDWLNDDDRLALVKECGFYCEYIVDDMCEDCPAKEYCDEYIDRKGGMESDKGAEKDE